MPICEAREVSRLNESENSVFDADVFGLTWRLLGPAQIRCGLEKVEEYLDVLITEKENGEAVRSHLKLVECIYNDYI